MLREGGCDLILAYYDPDAALQLDPNCFAAPGAHRDAAGLRGGPDGTPLYDVDSGQTVPLLAYSAGAFLGRSVNLLLRQRALRSTTVYETAMADSLKSMALQGLGIAWVPRLSVEPELERGELAIGGGEQWRVPLEIRLYRCSLMRKGRCACFGDDWRAAPSLPSELPPKRIKPSGGAVGIVADGKLANCAANGKVLLLNKRQLFEGCCLRSASAPWPGRTLAKERQP